MKNRYRMACRVVIDIKGDTKSEAVLEFNKISLNLPDSAIVVTELYPLTMIQMNPQAMLKTIKVPDRSIIEKHITRYSLMLLTICLEPIELTEALTKLRKQYHCFLEDSDFIAMILRLRRKGFLEITEIN